ncbi:short-chain fatty acyl-CoA regulator family protein [Rubellimicrobium sp. CFH 75288]|uniref:helix-turn-helix domain-containing protein n=1 Tax=Rubellimicrobium sp. CFH 75288 TaxID=2697034 RepID=UPI00141228C4|nr:helix-turn-helix transcriptional regulator [Rubellimicrobium sp. CFH 75288]NAZ38127.1 DUF2083 domain-containing protein [Rubellimicrobium sp. CFH 75288]
MASDARRKVMAGAQLRRLRTTLGLSQSAMAAELGISVSYLNLVERNQRPLTAQLLIRLNETYAVDARDFSGAEDARAQGEIEEVLADPVLRDVPVPRAELRAALDGAPGLLQALRRLHAAYVALAELQDGLAERAAPSERGEPLLPGLPDPVDRVRSFLQERSNHFPPLEDAAETIVAGLGSGDRLAAMVRRLEERHRIRFAVLTHAEMGAALRHYDRHRRRLAVSELVEPSGRAFQAAFQLGLIEAGEGIDPLLETLEEPQARRLGRIALLNYLAAAILMPYDSFLDAAQQTGYDVDLLAARFGASWEQVAHRLTTLSRPSARGVPFFMIRVDAAGNVSKRFSAGAFPFARMGGTCPRWNLHEALAHPGRTLTQVIEMPGGARWFSIARAVRRVTLPWGEPEPVFAVGLGCEIKYASHLVHARGWREAPAVPIGPNCRLCERPHCASRAAPPLARPLELSEFTRSLSPFGT